MTQWADNNASQADFIIGKLSSAKEWVNSPTADLMADAIELIREQSLKIDKFEVNPSEIVKKLKAERNLYVAGFSPEISSGVPPGTLDAVIHALQGAEEIRD